MPIHRFWSPTFFNFQRIIHSIHNTWIHHCVGFNDLCGVGCIGIVTGLHGAIFLDEKICFFSFFCHIFSSSFDKRSVQKFFIAHYGIISEIKACTLSSTPRWLWCKITCSITKFQRFFTRTLSPILISENLASRLIS